MTTKINTKRPISFWVAIVFLSVSLVLLVLGQTMAVFDYELAVDLGFQEDVKEISEFGVQINRAFGVSDTLVYIPLIILSIVGLSFKKRWALITTAAVMGISTYWATTVFFIFLFLVDVPGYSFVPGAHYWIFITAYIVFGICGIWYIIFRGKRLIS